MCVFCIGIGARVFNFFFQLLLIFCLFEFMNVFVTRFTEKKEHTNEKQADAFVFIVIIIRFQVNIYKFLIIPW